MKSFWTICSTRIRFNAIWLFLVVFGLSISFPFVSVCQDFSNKGRNFWLAYPDHVNRYQSSMGIYITSDVSTSGIIRVGNQNIPFTVSANTVTSKFIGPGSLGDAPNTSVINTLAEGILPNAGIQITSEKPVVVYSHIIYAARSGATLALPVNVLGKEYIVPSYWSRGGSEANSDYGEIAIVAPEAATNVCIVAAAPSRNGRYNPGDTIKVTLQRPGDVYQIQFARNMDISGTKVFTVPSADGSCKRIAVFSATTWSAFDCVGSTGGDNLFQQLFPIKSWGKKFLTAPFITKPYDIIRIFVNETSPKVFVTENGVRQQLTSLSGNGFYEIKTSNPLMIESEGEPISVVQYMISLSCDTRNPTDCYRTMSCPLPSDPEMIVINPIEQTINDISVFSAHRNWVPPDQSNVVECYLNIIIKTAQASSLRINGNVPTSPFTNIPGTAYSYIQENVTGISINNPVQNIKADSPFIAIAYGYGSVESYGYNAGTNVKDFSQKIQVRNVYQTVDIAAACRNSPFRLSISLASANPVQMRWTAPDISLDTTVFNPVFDSIWNEGGKTLYRFTLMKSLLSTKLGVLPVRVIATNPGTDGCSNLQEIDYDLEIFERPKAAFDIISTGCFEDKVKVIDRTDVTDGRAVYKWFWDFGNGFSTGSSTAEYSYTSRGQKKILLSNVSDVGCISDTVANFISLSVRPIADIEVLPLVCEGQPTSFKDASQHFGEVITKWYWTFGDPLVDSTSGSKADNQVFSATGDISLTLAIRTNTGCLSATKHKPVRINPTPVADFILPEVCTNDGIAIFKDTSKISDGSQAAFSYKWNFGGLGSPPNTSITSISVPRASTYPVQLIVTSNKGCKDTIDKSFVVNGDRPNADFNIANTSPLCSNTDILIKNNSSVDYGNVTRAIIYWDADNNPLDTIIDENPFPGKIYSRRQPDFGSPSNKPYRIKLLAFSGVTCFNEVSRNITLNASPQIIFDKNQDICAEKPGYILQTARETSGLPGVGIYSGKGVASNQFVPGTAGPGTHILRYTFTTTLGCTAFKEQPIRVFPTPMVRAGSDTGFLEGDTLQIMATAAGLGLTFLWTPSLGLNNTQIIRPKAYPSYDTKYTIRATSVDGCVAYDDLKVFVLLKPVIPNTITPNGDGINDKWEIRNLNLYPDAVLEVYNTAGQILYKSLPGMISWDGTYKNKPLPAGTYYYILYPKLGRPPTSGYITILR